MKRTSFPFGRIWRRKGQSGIGLALGGGAARGFAHVGVIVALNRANIPISVVTGTSVGALIGAIYAMNGDAAYILRHSRNISPFTVAGPHFPIRSFVSAWPLELFLRRHLQTKTMKDLAIPFAAVTTDIRTGKCVVLSDPDLDVVTAVLASTAFPGIYPAVKVGSQLLFDGCPVCNVPVSAALELGARQVIAVDIIPSCEFIEPENAIALGDRGLDILLRNSVIEEKKKADVVLEPLGQWSSSLDFSTRQALMKYGEESVFSRINDIKKLL